MLSSTLQANSNLFKTAFERSAVPKLLVLPQGQIIWANRAMCQLLGYSRKKMLGLQISDLIQTQDLSRQVDATQQLLAGQVTDYQLELHILPGSGPAIQARLQMFAHRNAQQILFLIAEIQETSQQKSLGQLQTNEIERLKNAEAMAHVGSWDFVFATGLCHWSEESRQILGFRPETNALSPENSFYFLHPDDRNQVINKFNESIKLNLDFKALSRIIKQNGEIRHLQLDARIHYNQLGLAVSLGGSLLDTTRVQMQEYMRQETNRLLQIQKQQLKEVAIQVSQNIQGPLNLIKAIKEKPPENPAQTP